MKTAYIFGIAFLTLVPAGAAQAATGLAGGCYQYIGFDYGDGEFDPAHSNWADSECTVSPNGAIIAPNDPTKSLTFTGTHLNYLGEGYFNTNSETTTSFWPQIFGNVNSLSPEESLFFPAVADRSGERDALIITATSAATFSVMKLDYLVATGEWWDQTWIDPWLVSGSTPSPFAEYQDDSIDFWAIQHDAEKWAAYYDWFDYYKGPLFQLNGYRNDTLVGYSVINAPGTESTGSLNTGDVFKNIDKLVISYLEPRIGVADLELEGAAPIIKSNSIFCQWMCTSAFVLDSLDYTVNSVNNPTPSPVPLPASAPLMAGALAFGGWVGRRRTRD